MQRSETFVYALDGKPYINLTNRCCNACTFCIRTGGDGVQGSTLWLSREPTAQEVIAQLDAFAPPYTQAVFCGYGEPTVRLPELTAVADWLHGKGKRVRLNTNGLGSAIAGQSIVPQLAGRVDTVSVSLNAATAEAYQAVCRSQFGLRAYDALLAFSRDCVAAGIETVLTVVDVIPPAEIEACKKVAASIGARLRVRGYIADNEHYR